MKQVVYVGVAGAVGAILRTGLGQIVDAESGFPIATFSVNLIGTFLLCFVVAKIAGGWLIKKNMEVALQTGFLGSFTTFSAFSMETVHLFETGQNILAILYVSGSIIFGLSAGLLGFSLGKKRRIS